MYKSLIVQVTLLGLVLGCNRGQEAQQAEEASGSSQVMAQGAEGQAENAPGTEVDVARAVVTPIDYVGVAVKGTGTVTEVVSDRGFWLEVDGKRLFAVVREDVPRPEMIEIRPGQTLQFTGLMLSPGAKDDLAGSLEQKTKNIIGGQPAFVAMHWRDIQIIQGPGSHMPMRGTDPNMPMHGTDPNTQMQGADPNTQMQGTDPNTQY